MPTLLILTSRSHDCLRAQQVLLLFLLTQSSTIECVFLDNIVYLFTSSGHLIASETSFLPKIFQMNHLLEPGIAKRQKSWMNVWLTEDWWDGSREGWYHGWEFRESGWWSRWRKPGSFPPSSSTSGWKWLSHHSPGECVTDTQMCNAEPKLSGLKLFVF